MRRAFTLVELLVVVGMIAVLSGAIVTSVSKANKRARLSKANVEVRELTNAIVSYQNFTKDGSLAAVASSLGGSTVAATKSNVGFVLGEPLGDIRGSSDTFPVLYNGSLVDPWGNPYMVTVHEGEAIQPPGVPSVELRLFYPNWHRLSEGE